MAGSDANRGSGPIPAYILCWAQRATVACSKGAVAVGGQCGQSCVPWWTGLLPAAHGTTFPHDPAPSGSPSGTGLAREHPHPGRAESGRQTWSKNQDNFPRGQHTLGPQRCRPRRGFVFLRGTSEGRWKIWPKGLFPQELGSQVGRWFPMRQLWPPHGLASARGTPRGLLVAASQTHPCRRHQQRDSVRFGCERPGPLGLQTGVSGPCSPRGGAHVAAATGRHRGPGAHPGGPPPRWRGAAGEQPGRPAGTLHWEPLQDEPSGVWYGGRGVALLGISLRVA